ncbi:MAG: DUF4164 domain-containing protein [Beijerinckiaceae bacterium]|jgi:FtsZ-binding cell division protein ZapB|nr:DUF4164 domain-containing protein [Beijerinckiaceae bacterium]
MSSTAPSPRQAVPARTSAALKRFVSALDLLEAALDRHAANVQAVDNLKEELAVMQDDRARLAAELDGALHRNNSLGVTNEQVKQRLDQASATIRAILVQNNTG